MPRSSARKSARLSVSGVKNGKTAAEELDRLLQERGKESAPDGMPTLLLKAFSNIIFESFI